MNDLNPVVLQKLSAIISSNAEPRQKLEASLRLLAKWRSVLIQNAMTHTLGTNVWAGPFSGMRFLPNSLEGCHVPKLLGCYESELHPHLLRLAKRGYDTVINVGAAEGYYAVGLARLFPNARVLAFDTNPAAGEVCRKLAQLNDVSARLEILGELTGESLANYASGRTLMVCDIEGGEKDLLDPRRFPALRRIDIIVELHDVVDPTLSQTVPQRFADSHDVVLVHQRLTPVELPDFSRRWNHLDQLLAVWEWRSGPTPWAVMTMREAK